jgi:hypothetical protein
MKNVAIRGSICFALLDDKCACAAGPVRKLLILPATVDQPAWRLVSAMKKNAKFAVQALCGCFLSIGVSETSLIDRGGGLIYDDVLNVTWLQDAQYAITFGYSSSGRLTWNEAMTWASGLEYFDSVRGVSWSDWRLPTTVNDLSSRGWDITGQSSELAYRTPTTRLSISPIVATGPEPFRPGAVPHGQCTITSACKISMALATG